MSLTADAKAALNETYKTGAYIEGYVYVDTDVQYADGSYGMAEFEMVQTDEGWFFTRIW